MQKKQTKVSGGILNERKWTPGSYAAAGFAIIILVFGLTISILSMTWPTDGWFLSGDSLSDPPNVVFGQNFLDGLSPIETGDQLLAINGQTLVQLLEAQHAFVNSDPPDWQDGTRLQYEVLRDGEQLLIDVPIRRASFWEFFQGYFMIGLNNSNLVMLITGLLFFIIGIIVFLLRPSNRAAHALLFIGIGFFPIIGNETAPTFFYPDLPASIPFDTWTLMINPSLMYLVLAFPYPKAPLRRFPRLSVLLLYLSWPVAFNVAYLLHMQDWRGYQDIAFAIYPVQIILMMLVTLGALIHTTITVRDPVGRSQVKWMLLGIGSFVFVGIGGWLVSAYIFPETMARGNWLITTIGWFLLPVCLAIAITRYRLFDIDVIIRRTLVYGVLSITLTLVFFGSVLLLQGLFQSITGQSQSPAVTVLSTLAIAALFTPLRRYIQNAIDRRFYRRKFNAELATAAFAAVARDAIDPEAVCELLLSTVNKTIQPEHISIWQRLTDDNIQNLSENPYQKPSEGVISKR